MAKILFPTDFSSAADNALDYAVSLARAANGSLILFHVLPNPIGYEGVPAMYLEEEMEILRNENDEKLQAIKQRIQQKYPQIGCATEISPGPLLPAILSLIDSESVDWVVMGTTGASGIKKALIGSHAASVVTHAPCPVVTVPEGHAFDGIKKVVYATEYLEEDLTLLQKLMELAGKFNASITLLHIATEEKAEEEKKFIRFRKTIERKINYPFLYFELIVHSNIQEGIDDYLTSNQADLLAMSMKKRSLFHRLFQRSETKQMAYHARIPLLAFHTGS